MTTEKQQLSTAINCVITLTEENKRLRKCLSPRFWDLDMIEAWHQNIPDTQKAFDALLELAVDKKDE